MASNYKGLRHISLSVQDTELLLRALTGSGLALSDQLKAIATSGRST